MSKYNVGINYEVDADSPEEAQRLFAETIFRIIREDRDCIEEYIEVCKIESKKREQDLLDVAKEILSDFNRYGEVLQVGDNGEYGMESAIGRLSAAIQRFGF